MFFVIMYSIGWIIFAWSSIGAILIAVTWKKKNRDHKTVEDETIAAVLLLGLAVLCIFVSFLNWRFILSARDELIYGLLYGIPVIAFIGVFTVLEITAKKYASKLSNYETENADSHGSDSAEP